MGSTRAANCSQLKLGTLLLLVAGLAPLSACTRSAPPAPAATAPTPPSGPALAAGPSFAKLEERLASTRDATPERLEAVAALGRCEDPRAEPRLRLLIEDARADAALRAAAALALGQHSGRAALPVLAPLLGDSHGEVREAAARALGGLGGDPARSALEERLAAEESERVRETLQQSLSRLEP